MDVFLASISLDWFRILVWTVAIPFGVLGFFISNHKRYWEIVVAALSGLLLASFAFLLANLAVSFYILSDMTNPRWSAGKDPLMTQNDIQSPLGIFDGIVNDINGLQQNVAGAVNTVGYMQNAVGVAVEFFWMVVWSIGAIFVLAVCTLLTMWWSRKMTARQKDKDEAAEKLAVQAKLDEQDANLAEIRVHLEMDPFQKPER